MMCSCEAMRGKYGQNRCLQHYKETFWEQLDEGVQGTWNRKFLTIVPALLCGIAVHTADYEHKMLGVNIAAVLVSVM